MAKAILITGATSKIGATLVANLLLDTPNSLWLMIRKTPREPDIRRRLEKALTLQNRPVDLSQFENRLVIFKGDVSKRQLGIEDAVFERLLKTGIEEVVHLAALTDRREFTKDSLFAVTYQGTNKVLRLAWRLGVKTFNHLGMLYCCGTRQGVIQTDDYLNFVESNNDFNNLNEFVHQLTIQHVMKGCSELGMNYRVLNPGFLMELDNFQDIQKRWYYYVLETIFDIERLYKALYGEDCFGQRPIIFPALDVRLHLCTPDSVANFISALLQEGEKSLNRCYSLFDCARSVRHLIGLLERISPTLRTEFADSGEALPLLEMIFLRRSLIFFEYLFQHKDFAPDPEVARVAAVHALPVPDFSDAAVTELARECYKRYCAEPHPVSYTYPIRMLLRLGSRLSIPASIMSRWIK